MVTDNFVFVKTLLENKWELVKITIRQEGWLAVPIHKRTFRDVIRLSRNENSESASSRPCATIFATPIDFEVVTAVLFLYKGILAIRIRSKRFRRGLLDYRERVFRWTTRTRSFI